MNACRRISSMLKGGMVVFWLSNVSGATHHTAVLAADNKVVALVLDPRADVGPHLAARGLAVLLALPATARRCGLDGGEALVGLERFTLLLHLLRGVSQAVLRH